MTSISPNGRGSRALSNSSSCLVSRLGVLQPPHLGGRSIPVGPTVSEQQST